MELSILFCIFVMSNQNKNIMTKEKIIENIKNVKVTTARNSMGCSENWYNSFWAISQTFTMEEIEAMTEKELNDLVKLANNIADGLY